ncbi:conserved hypothetical protein [Thiomonas sp. X19]|uniref:FitA-like ribbon-helix-helix domain-containing protein n=1 Tax=Thiomonas sp. X19 TaxID=1050370 RepID=UPI000B6F8BFE|nr:Arc family DNA-binding protein [Thiomonas sp. X19]SCC95527.1 conserved hypothetical protein [Thiomonas sp. X19]
MTVSLSIKEVPESLAERLRQRAARNHRSLQGELMSILERAALDDASSNTRSAPPSSSQQDQPQTASAQRGWKSIEQIAAEHLARFPKPIASGPRAVDIIRAERDSR